MNSKKLTNFSAIIEKSFNDTLNAPQAVQTEINGLSPAVLQNGRVLDALTAQQGGTCPVIGELLFLGRQIRNCYPN